MIGKTKNIFNSGLYRTEDTGISIDSFRSELSNRLYIKKVIYGDEKINSDAVLFKKRQSIRIVASADKIDAAATDVLFADDPWMTIAQTLVPNGRTFGDHAFTYELPFTPEELSTVTDIASPSLSNVEYEYNFYQKEYETSPAMGGFTTQMLPNLYTYSLAVSGDLLKSDNEIMRHVTLNGNLMSKYVSKLNRRGEKGFNMNTDEYYKKFASATKRATNFGTMPNNYSQIMFPSTGVKFALEANEAKYLFPMYADIEFSTDTMTLFADAMKETKTSCVFMKDMLIAQTEISPWNFEALSTIEETAVPTIRETRSGKVYGVSTEKSFNSERACLDIGEWILNVATKPADSIDGKGTFMSVSNKETKLAADPLYSTQKDIALSILLGKLRGIIGANWRTADNIFTDDFAYSETVLYKIEKHAQNVTDSPMQVFWIPNASELDVMKFVDTQVKYNTSYTYIVKAYQFVLGTEYTYSNLAVSQKVSSQCVELIDVNTQQPVAPRVGDVKISKSKISDSSTLYVTPSGGEFFAEFDVIQVPSIKLVEVPFSRHEGVFVDDPPLSPNVEVIPYNGMSNVMKFSFEGSTGEVIEQPVIFDISDALFAEEYRNTKRLGPDDPITYSADDYPVSFEMYRLTVPPTKFEDFANNIRASVTTTSLSSGQPIRAASAAYVDAISPNTKYYYTFRAIDVHGKKSNPSAVYEIEVVDDNGAIYPAIRTVQFSEEVPKQASIPARRYIQISPRYLQRLINEDKSNFGDYDSAKDITGKLVMGLQDETVWDRKFKVRLISKKTGRKLDINLNFIQKHNKSEISE